jgi:transposase
VLSSAAATARALGVSRHTLARWVDEAAGYPGDPPYVHVGTRRKWEPVAAVLAWRKGVEAWRKKGTSSQAAAARWVPDWSQI